VAARHVPQQPRTTAHQLEPRHGVSTQVLPVTPRHGQVRCQTCDRSTESQGHHGQVSQVVVSLCTSAFAFQRLYEVKGSLYGLVVGVLGYRSGGPGSIPGTTRKKSSGSGTAFTQPREYN
jgi:hypothetical protein